MQTLITNTYHTHYEKVLIWDKGRYVCKTVIRFTLIFFIKATCILAYIKVKNWTFLATNISLFLSPILGRRHNKKDIFCSFKVMLYWLNKNSPFNTPCCAGVGTPNAFSVILKPSHHPYKTLYSIIFLYFYNGHLTCILMLFIP